VVAGWYGGGGWHGPLGLSLCLLVLRLCYPPYPGLTEVGRQLLEKGPRLRGQLHEIAERFALAHDVVVVGGDRGELVQPQETVAGLRETGELRCHARLRDRAGGWPRPQDSGQVRRTGFGAATLRTAQAALAAARAL
jgi:hypothetical protein